MVDTAVPPVAVERRLKVTDPLALDLLQSGIRRESFGRHVVRDDEGVVRAVQCEERVDQLGRGAGRLGVHRQQVAQRPFARRHVAAKVREVRARLQRRWVARTQLVEHRVGAAGGVGIPQVTGRRELMQHDVVARVALEFGKRGILAHRRACGVKVVERLARISAAHGEYREPGLRL